MTPASNEPVQSNQSLPDRFQQQQQVQPLPLITPEIRLRIVATLETLKGKRGAPFSFVTSEEGPHQGGGAVGMDGVSTEQSTYQRSSAQALPGAEPSLNLSSLLRPLVPSHRAQVIDTSTTKRTLYVKMPTYVASMSLSQTVHDPIDAGMLSVQASTALFEHFMNDMNAKWEYLLDPRFDTHDNVRARSRLLFATILFCSSKFASHSGSGILPTPDPYLQTRLCSLARSLAVTTFAQGDRSIETIQAFYLLVCWKDPEDDVSYLHSGYAFRIMQDLDLRQDNGDKQQAARRRRTWLALFRQDKQQSLFFVRKPYMAVGDEPPPFLVEMDMWLQNPYTSPLDIAGCCSADVRQIQSKLHVMVRGSSSLMQPCLLEVMNSDLRLWRTRWQNRFNRRARDEENEDEFSENRPLRLEKSHWNALLGLWEHSVKLNIASMILRQAFAVSMTSSRGSHDQAPPLERLDLPGIGEVSSPNVPGLRECVDGAFGTLQSLLAFPVRDLRKAPDSVLLLGPNAALFLCLLLVFPCDGILGVNFQKTAIGLITDLARHTGECVESPQDTVDLHSAYLNSLADLVSPVNSSSQQLEMQNLLQQSTYLSQVQMDPQHTGFHQAELQAAQDLAGMAGRGGIVGDYEDFHLAPALGLGSGTPHLANLLDMWFFWDMSSDTWV
ncbi:hypothetical protein F5883DRAFT_583041 [Diaporthe sp. PMI_573]|nr:hypothetical protein F5883DRAFT_583041 [Diaporthaceae sp. PMI_573]